MGIARIVLAAASAVAAVAAQPVVVAGTGDPRLDVPAVQAAVDHGGQIVLKGRFSFDTAPTKPAGTAYRRTITVSKAVALSGGHDQRGEMPTITAGTVPLYEDAPGAPVTIRGLRFVGAKGTAIWIHSVRGLTIADCKIEGVEPTSEFAGYAGLDSPVAVGVFIGSNPTPPRAGQDEEAENNFGTLTVFKNNIDVGGTVRDRTLGICVFGVGRLPDRKADLHIVANHIRNITERGINTNLIGGDVHVERNVIATGTVTGPTNGVQPDVIHAVGSGLYRIAHNSIVSEWAAGAGIRVQGSAWSPESRALVEDNDVTMLAPEDTVFGANSAGIEIRGNAQANTVRNNRIRGRARAALAEVERNGAAAHNNSFVSNRLEGFEPPSSALVPETQ
jgi:hypothetical protein